MKRILLVGNGFDIQFNNEFCQKKIISKFVDNGKVSLNVFYQYLNRINCPTYNRLKLYENILDIAFKKALVWSSSKDSIENIFSNVQTAIKEEAKKIYLAVVDFEYQKDALFLFEHLCKTTYNNKHELDGKKFIKLSIWGLERKNWYNIVASVGNSIKIYVEIIELLRFAFLDYLYDLSKTSEIEGTNLANKANTKLHGYDYIMTTNWTNIIDFLSPEEGGTIDHIHGVINSSYKEASERYENIKILSIENDEKDIELDDFNNYIKKIDSDEDVKFDIFGFSVENDSKTVEKILFSMKNVLDHASIYMHYYWYEKNDKELFDKLTESLNQNEDFKKVNYSIHESCEFYGLLEYNNENGAKDNENKHKKTSKNDR
jgi:hypothetical protein